MNLRDGAGKPVRRNAVERGTDTVRLRRHAHVSGPVVGSGDERRNLPARAQARLELATKAVCPSRVVLAVIGVAPSAQVHCRR